MASKVKNLHVVFFPLMAYGHMIPVIDIARQLASREIEVTIITTPANAPVFTKAFDKTRHPSFQIHIEVFEFPSEEAGIPKGIENTEDVTSQDMNLKLIKSTELFEKPLQKIFEEKQPNCIVADLFMPWVADLAVKFNIPRLVFHGSSYFSICIIKSLRRYEPYKAVYSDDEYFVVPNLPDEIKLSGRMMSSDFKQGDKTEFGKFLKKAFESDNNSYGILMNTFYELEPAYADYYRNVVGQRSWHIGPVSLSNRNIEEKAIRGKQAAIDQHEWLEWLDSREPNSVVYLCFGSMTKFSTPQLHEIAMALEASELNFIWVIRGGISDKNGDLPEGFEERIKSKGLIIRGWAPQVMILDHESTAAFVTHCGWNSILEGIAAGKPMVTWPVFAEQFFNEQLVTQILKIGVPAGCKQYFDKVVTGISVQQGDVEKALRRIMVGEESTEMRSRALKLKAMASKAVEEGGSSYSDLSALIQELSCYQV